MKRIKLKDRVLPEYTKGEEIFNMTSHIVGGVLGVIATILCLIFAIIRHHPYGIISSIIYGISMISLYTMSSIYHGLKPDTTAKKVFQILDHCSIFLLICTLREYDTVLGWTIFGVIWGFAILGIILNAIDLKRFRVFSMICYLIMGWCIIIKINILPNLLSIPGFVLLVAGGIVYTIGAIFYGFGRKVKYMHSIFHLFIFFGSLLQFLCILLYVV